MRIIQKRQWQSNVFLFYIVLITKLLYLLLTPLMAKLIFIKCLRSISEDLQTSSSDFYQTQWEEYYNQLAEAESVESPTTYNKNSDFLSLVHKNALKDKQDFLGLGGMDVSISYSTTFFKYLFVGKWLGKQLFICSFFFKDGHGVNGSIYVIRCCCPGSTCLCFYFGGKNFDQWRTFIKYMWNSKSFLKKIS